MEPITQQEQELFQLLLDAQSNNQLTLDRASNILLEYEGTDGFGPALLEFIVRFRSYEEEEGNSSSSSSSSIASSSSLFTNRNGNNRTSTGLGSTVARSNSTITYRPDQVHACRLLAATQVKNIIHRRWKGNESTTTTTVVSPTPSTSSSTFSAFSNINNTVTSPSSTVSSGSSSSSSKLSPTDATFIRQELIPILADEPSNRVAGSLISSLTRIVKYDWPYNWEDVFSTLLSPFEELLSSIPRPSMQTKNKNNHPTSFRTSYLDNLSSIRMLRICTSFNKMVKELNDRKLAEERNMLAELSDDLVSSLVSVWISLMDITIQGCIEASTLSSQRETIDRNEYLIPLNSPTTNSSSSSTNPSTVTTSPLQSTLHNLQYLMNGCRQLTKGIVRLINCGTIQIFLSSSFTTFYEQLCKYIPELLKVLPVFVTAGSQILGSLSNGITLETSKRISAQSVVAGCRLTDTFLDTLDLSTNGGGGSCFRRFLHRLIRASTDIMQDRPMPFAASGCLNMIVPILATALVEPPPLPPLPQASLVSIFILLSDIATRGSKYVLKDGVPPGEEEGGNLGPKHLTLLCNDLYGKEQQDDWLGFLIERALPLTLTEVEEFCSEGEEAFLAEDVATRDINPRKAGEALLLAIAELETGGYATDLSDVSIDPDTSICIKALGFARDCEDELLSRTGQLTNSSGKLSGDHPIVQNILQLDAAWLAGSLLIPEAITYKCLTAAAFREWSISSILPIAYMCGLPVVTICEMVQELPVCAMDSSLLTEILEPLRSLSPGKLLQIARIPTLYLLRRLFYVVTICQGLMIPQRSVSPVDFTNAHPSNGTTGTPPLSRIGPLGTVYALLAIHAIEALTPLSNNRDTAHQAMRLSAIQTATGLVDGAYSNDPGLIHSSIVSMTANAVYTAIAEFNEIDSHLRALLFLFNMLQQCSSPIIVDTIEALLLPLEDLWAVSESQGMVRQHILSIVNSVVEALPVTLSPSPSSSAAVTDEALDTNTCNELLNFILPLLEVSCDASLPASRIYLNQEGTVLWETTLERLPVYTDKLHELFVLIEGLSKEATSDDNEMKCRLLRIASGYAVRGGEQFVNAVVLQSPASTTNSSANTINYGTILANLIDSMIGSVVPRVVPGITASINTILSALPELIPYLHRTWVRLLIAILLGKQEKMENEAKIRAAHSSTRNALMAALGNRNSNALGTRGITNSLNGNGAKNTTVNLPLPPQTPSAEADPVAMEAYLIVLARVWILNPEEFIHSINDAAMEYTACLVKCQLISPTEYSHIERVVKAIHGRTENVINNNDDEETELVGAWLGLRLLMEFMDTWLTAAVSTHTQQYASGDGEDDDEDGYDPSSSSTLLLRLWLRKLQCLAFLQGLRLVPGIHQSLMNPLQQYNSHLYHSLMSNGWNILSVDSGRIETSSQLLVNLTENLRIATESAQYIPGVTSNASTPVKDNGNVSKNRNGNLTESVKSLNFDNNGGHNGPRNGSSTRQKLFTSQPEVSEDLGEWLGNALQELQQLLNNEKKFNELLSRVSDEAIELANGK